LVSRRSDRGVGIHPRRLLNRWEAAAICYWSRGTPCSSEPAICVFFTRILTALQFGPFHTKVIAATANEAPYVLDGLLYHQSSLVINEHYTDTGGFSDHVFAMCRLLGFRFAPRIRDLKENRLYVLPGMTVPPELASLPAGAVNLRVISDHWFELLRLALSIKTGDGLLLFCAPVVS
jgi:Tn3 transposase DDE domain